MHMSLQIALTRYMETVKANSDNHGPARESVVDALGADILNTNGMTRIRRLLDEEDDYKYFKLVANSRLWDDEIPSWFTDDFENMQNSELDQDNMYSYLHSCIQKSEKHPKSRLPAELPEWVFYLAG
jgi:hypothetical protein